MGERTQTSPDLCSWHCGGIPLGWWASLQAGLQRGVSGLEQGEEEDTLGQIITGRHESLNGTKELVQVGSL